MQYQFKYRKAGRLFWNKKQVVGHKFEQNQNKMILYFANGSLIEIAHWIDHEVELGTDWVLAIKKDMESKAGQQIPLNIDIKE